MAMASTSLTQKFDNLCHKCEKLVLREDAFLTSLESPSQATEWIVKIDWELHDEWPDFTEASKKAKGQCAFCRAFHKTIRNCAGHQHIQKLLNTRPQTGAKFRASLCYVMYCENRGDNRLQSLRIKGDLDTGAVFQIDCPIAAATTSKHGQPSSLSLAEPLTHLNPDYLDWMRSKINLCINHGHLASQDGFVPDRLIKVDEDTLRLVLTTDSTNLDFQLPQAQCTDLPHYAALTYCWGPPPHSEKQLKTTTENLADHLSEIPTRKLPQTVKDAVEATRALSIPYLWVDALCILQNQSSDWEYQCMQMEKIYGNAHITICALVNNCEEGFIERNDKITIPYQYQNPSKNPGAFSIYQPSYHRTSVDDMMCSSWIVRGWTFQERGASTRILSFGASNVHFQCSLTQSSTSEYQNFYELECVRRDLLNESAPDELYLQWNNQVAAEFSLYGFEFTRATDVLPSLAGLATLFASKLHDRYLAGLWEEDLYRSLIWNTQPEAKPSYSQMLDRLRHPSPYIAPSWSWASRNTLVFFEAWGDSMYYYSAYLECDILETMVVPVGTSIFGELMGGYLDISGNVYDGPRRLSFAKVGDQGDLPFISPKTLQLDDQYLLDLNMDCNSRDLFIENGERYELKASVSFLMIGSSSNKPRSFWDYRNRSLDAESLTEDEASQVSGSDDLVPSDGSYSSQSPWDIRPGSKPENRQTPLSKEELQLRRLAYGLVILPAERPGEFYRVGTFVSRRKVLGGLVFFESCETKSIRLV